MAKKKSTRKTKDRLIIEKTVSKLDELIRNERNWMGDAAVEYFFQRNEKDVDHSWYEDQIHNHSWEIGRLTDLRNMLLGKL